MVKMKNMQVIVQLHEPNLTELILGPREYEDFYGYTIICVIYIIKLIQPRVHQHETILAEIFCAKEFSHVITYRYLIAVIEKLNTSYYCKHIWKYLILTLSVDQTLVCLLTMLVCHTYITYYILYQYQ